MHMLKFFVLLFSTSIFSLFANSFPKTEQKILPTGFGYFENLYFDPSTISFVALGKNIDLDKAVYIPEPRGYFWFNYKKMPYGLRNKEIATISGTTIILLERNATPFMIAHYFHFLEHLLGIWNFAGDVLADDVKMVFIAGNGIQVHDWKGPNEVTAHLIRALFPNAEVKLWNELAHSTEKMLLFERVITSDRCLDYIKSEPFYTERMLGGYFSHLTQASLQRMSDCVHNYTQAVYLPSDKLKVTYVKRGPKRRLAPDLERQLLSKIQELPHIDLQVVDFATLSFHQQIQAVASTDVLLGVHGNGLSNALFLPKGATLIELFPENSLRVEYQIFAKTRGVHYHGLISNGAWVTDEMTRKGVFGEVNQEIRQIDIDAIIECLNNCPKAFAM